MWTPRTATHARTNKCSHIHVHTHLQSDFAAPTANELNGMVLFSYEPALSWATPESDFVAPTMECINAPYTPAPEPEYLSFASPESDFRCVCVGCVLASLASLKSCTHTHILTPTYPHIVRQQTLSSTRSRTKSLIFRGVPLIPTSLPRTPMKSRMARCAFLCVCVSVRLYHAYSPRKLHLEQRS